MEDLLKKFDIKYSKRISKNIRYFYMRGHKPKIKIVSFYIIEAKVNLKKAK